MNILHITYFINGFLMMAMPVALGIYLTRKFDSGWRLWLIGGAVFVLSQVGHIPFNAGVGLLFQKGILPGIPPAWQLPFSIVFLGLSAGLFEELARYAMFRWWAKDARSWRAAILTGAGHGGAEAIILGALVLFNYVVMLAMRGADLATVVPAEQLALAQEQINTYWSAAWYDTLLGALERFFTLPVQIGFAVIVAQTFIRKQWWWVWLAVLWHAAVDGLAVWASQTLNLYLTEALIGGIALINLSIIFALRQAEPLPAPVPSLPHLPLPPSIAPPEETPENLDKAKYT